MQFQDLIYEIRNSVAWIIINRPRKMNAFRGTTCDELIKAFYKAGYDKDIGCIVLAGASDRAFCTGGDQSAHDGNYDGRGTIGLPMEELHTAIRDVPKPVIARVQGYAIGGGNVLATICDMTICSERRCSDRSARAWDRSIPATAPHSWRASSAKEGARDLVHVPALFGAGRARAMGLANLCVPHDELDKTIAEMGRGTLRAQPTAIAIAKRSFNMDTAHQAGIAGMGMYALKLYYDTEDRAKA